MPINVVNEALTISSIALREFPFNHILRARLAFIRLSQLDVGAASAEMERRHSLGADVDNLLDRAWEFRDPRLAYLKADILLNPLRSDARFAALVKKLNFPA